MVLPSLNYVNSAHAPELPPAAPNRKLDKGIPEGLAGAHTLNVAEEHSKVDHFV